MNLGAFLPSPTQLSKETLAVVGATLISAWIISRFPAVQRFVSDNSVTVRSLENGG